MPASLSLIGGVHSFSSHPPDRTGLSSVARCATRGSAWRSRRSRQHAFCMLRAVLAALSWRVRRCWITELHNPDERTREGAHILRLTVTSAGEYRAHDRGGEEQQLSR